MKVRPALLPAAAACALTSALLGGCSFLAPTAPELPDAQIATTYPLDPVAVGEVDGVTIRDGGYSGLAISPDAEIWVTTDRGPNLEAHARVGGPAKRFPVPAYTPAAERVEVVDGRLVVRERLSYLTPAGRAATGLPPPTLDRAVDVEQALGPDFRDAGHDGEGIDAEGIAFDAAGGMWVTDEYRPSLWRVDAASGSVRARYTPTPTATADRALPDWLLQRAPNLGFEGVAVVGEYVYASLQGPLRPPGGDRATRITRLLRLDPATGQTQSYAYALEGSTRKIGDLAVANDGRLLVLEHGLIPGRGWSAEVYAVRVDRLTALPDAGLPPERYRDPESAITGGVALAPKTLYVDLLAAGWDPAWDKPEGLAAAGDGSLLLVNDNDYGLVSPNADGRAEATNAETVLVVVR